MSTLFLDACVVMYRMEAVEPSAFRLTETVHALHEQNPGAPIAVSELTRLECRIHPMRNEDSTLLLAYDAFFAADGLTVVALTTEVVDLATSIRARYGLRTPDALQAASCLSLGRPARFVTNDAGFRRVPDLDVVLI